MRPACGCWGCTASRAWHTPPWRPRSSGRPGPPAPPLPARGALPRALAPLAKAEGLELVEGKMVVELMPDRPRKGGAVLRLAEELDLRGVLFAGDDVADLEAFEALDRLRDRGVLAVRGAVRGAETPASLRD